MISRGTFQLLPFSDSVIFLSLVNLVLLVIEVHKLDSFNSPLPFSLNYSVSCSSVLFLPSLPNLFYIIFLLLQCKSLSTITSALSAKVIFTTFLIVLFPWDQIPTFHPWLFQFSTITHTWLLFCVYLLILCLVSSIIKLPSTYVRFLQYFPCLCFPFVITFLQFCWPVPWAARSAPTVFLLYFCGEFYSNVHSVLTLEVRVLCMVRVWVTSLRCALFAAVLNP